MRDADDGLEASAGCIVFCDTVLVVLVGPVYDSSTAIREKCRSNWSLPVFLIASVLKARDDVCVDPVGVFMDVERLVPSCDEVPSQI